MLLIHLVGGWNPKMFSKVINIRSTIMAMMLCGDIDWHSGCVMHNNSDEWILEHFSKAWDLDHPSSSERL